MISIIIIMIRSSHPNIEVRPLYQYLFLKAMWTRLMERATKLPDEMIAEIWSFSLRILFY